MFHRRHLLGMLIGSCACTAHTARGRATDIDAGCFLQASSVGRGSFATIEKLGQPILDQAYATDVRALVHAFGVRPFAGFYNDASPNARASNRIYNPSNPDGTILFGVNLLVGELQ
ncbi:MAG: hypothetical protein AAGF59_08305, partial [Pseudomonadota bacterium]